MFVDGLSEKGRIAIVLPYRIVSGSEQADIRDFLFRNSYVSASISLPAGAFRAFGGSAARPALLLLQKETPKARFLAQAEELGYDLGRESYRPVVDNDDLGQIAEDYAAARAG